MKRSLIFLIALGFSGAALASPITVNPGDACAFGLETSQSAINTILAGTVCGKIVGDELYKDNAGGVEEKALAGSYNTTYNSGLSGGTIEYTGGAFIGPVAWLLVKDGAGPPGWYIFNLTDDLEWDGKGTITLEKFWDGTQFGNLPAADDGVTYNSTNGAISHVSLFGTRGVEVPEPTALALLGFGLLGMGFARRRRS